MEQFKKIPVIFDGDPGHDDAIAWTIAHASGMFDIRAITTTSGNTTIENSTYNALRICALIGLNVPVGMGVAKPLYSPKQTTPSVHGKSGLDGPALPEPVFEKSELGAVELMAKVLREAEEPITLVPTGPLTNVAALFLAHPELKCKIKQISLMGGGIAFGNWTPAAEYNILVDPEAAKIVYEAGIPIYMAGLDVTEKALVQPQDFQRIAAIGGPVCDVVSKWLEFFYQFHFNLGYPGAPLHDPCAIMVLLHPEIFDLRPMYVQVETCGDLCKGCTVGDVFGVSGQAPNATVLMGVDREKFVDYLVDYMKFYGEGAKNA